MTAPSLPVQFSLPTDGAQPLTYPQLLKTLECAVTAGAQLKPTALPSATINIGDIIADISGKLQGISSAYSIITTILRMITCIIDVICAISNPFALIPAVIRLFGTCLPEFILILPQFAIPAKILCLIKIVVAIVQYTLTVIVPIITDIIENVNDIIEAFSSQNNDAIAAVAFKIVALIKQLYSIIGILQALEAIFIMVEALLSLGIGIPCSGGGGSCSGCGEDQCPGTLQEDSLTGTDGVLIVIFGSSGFDYSLKFFSAAQKENLLAIRDFFPRGLDYGELETDQVPYLLTVDSNSYAVSSVDSGGTLSLVRVQNPQFSDGYLSSVFNSLGVPTAVSSPSTQVRFGTDTSTFTSSNLGDYLEIQETGDADDADLNSGTFQINLVYNSNSVRLVRPDGDTDGWNSTATLDVTSHITWRIVPKSPSSGGNKSFALDINHDELLRHELIGVGCHPSVKATAEGVSNRFPGANDLELPTLPSFSTLLSNTTACLEKLAPENVTTAYVIDNYNTIATEAANVADCLTTELESFESSMLNYATQIYPRIYDPERSADTLKAVPAVQAVGSEIKILFTPFDRYGNKLAANLPEGVIDVDIFATEGNITSATEVLDDYGIVTGEFSAILTSDTPIVANVSASISDIFAADFDGYDLVTKNITAEFVPSIGQRGTGIIDEGTVEPIGAGPLGD